MLFGPALDGLVARGRLEAAQQVERGEEAGGLSHEFSSCIAYVFFVCRSTGLRGG
jgi:hypothetical protein